MMLLFISFPGGTEILIISAFSIVITFFLCRWIFRVDTIADNLKIQTHLLIKIAKHNNVPVEEINRLITVHKEQFPAVVGHLQKEEELKS